MFICECQRNMILKNLNIFFQNVRKNNFIINTILESHSSFDIIFIQEPSWSTLCSILSHTNCKGGPLMGVVNHPNWLTFARESVTPNNHPRVIMFINIRLFSFWFSLYKDIINYRDILLSSFFNNGEIFWLMNIYSDLSHSTIRYLKDTEFNFWNLLIMTGDFNIWDSLWDSSYNHHSSISNDLIAIADSFNLSLLFSTDYVPTRYSDNMNDSNLVTWCSFIVIPPNWTLIVSSLTGISLQIMHP